MNIGITKEIKVTVRKIVDVVAIVLIAGNYKAVYIAKAATFFLNTCTHEY